MSGKSPTVKDKEQKSEAHITQPSNKNNKKNDAPKVSYVRDTDVSKRPTVQDGIQKKVVRHERKSQATWEEKFSFLSGEVFHQPRKLYYKAGLPSDTFKRKKVDTSIVQHFPINLSPSPPVPKTSLALVGWRSAREECRLEFKGQMYISPKCPIDPPLEPGAVPMTEQRFIILYSFKVTSIYMVADNRIVAYSMRINIFPAGHGVLSLENLVTELTETVEGVNY